MTEKLYPYDDQPLSAIAHHMKHSFGHCEYGHLELEYHATNSAD